MKQIIECINYLKDAQEEYSEARDRILKLAIHFGADEKFLNNDARCARAFLEGFKKASSNR